MAYLSKRISGTNPTATSFIKDEDAYLQATEANGDGSVEVLDPHENAGGSQKKRRKTSGSQKKRRNTRSKSITFSDLAPHMGVLPLGAVAKKYQVRQSTLRTRCRQLRIRQWPYTKGNVNKVHDQLRIIELILMDITCPEMDYEAAGKHPALLEKIMEEFKALI